MRSIVLHIKRGSRGFGLSLIYRGLDRHEESHTGVFVSKVVPGGQSERFGLLENDKIISINNLRPRNVEEAVGIIRDAGKLIQVVIVRCEDIPDDGDERLERQDSNENFKASARAEGNGKVDSKVVHKIFIK